MLKVQPYMVPVKSEILYLVAQKCTGAEIGMPPESRADGPQHCPQKCTLAVNIYLDNL
jgi:hypothetical protein